MLSMPAVSAAEYLLNEVRLMRDATQSATDLPNSTSGNEARDEVQGYGIKVPDFGPQMPSALNFTLPALGSPTSTAGEADPSLAMRKAGGIQGEFSIIGVL
ncbi:MAG TPA: hypothetical protein VKV26_00765 [Dehalococcoidia bacterium]|nr:hypothetical protein [Dehalococcoidia bacterium]